MTLDAVAEAEGAAALGRAFRLDGSGASLGRRGARVVQFSTLAAELAGLVELAIAFGPDVALAAGEPP